MALCMHQPLQNDEDDTSVLLDWVKDGSGIQSSVTLYFCLSDFWGGFFVVLFKFLYSSYQQIHASVVCTNLI